MAWQCVVVSENVVTACPDGWMDERMVVVVRWWWNGGNTCFPIPGLPFLFPVKLHSVCTSSFVFGEMGP